MKFSIHLQRPIVLSIVNRPLSIWASLWDYDRGRNLKERIWHCPDFLFDSVSWNGKGERFRLPGDNRIAGFEKLFRWFGIG